MTDFQQRAGTLALPESRFANLGQRIVQAAQLAVLEHLRQDQRQSYPLPIVTGGADHANGDAGTNRDRFPRNSPFSIGEAA